MRGRVKDLYAVLGADPTASADQLRRAYRETVRRTHPDAGGRPEDFRDVRQAWAILGDPDRRLAYDRHLMEARQPDEPWQRPSVGVFSTRTTVLGPVAMSATMLVLALVVVHPLAAVPGLVLTVGTALRVARGGRPGPWALAVVSGAFVLGGSALLADGRTAMVLGAATLCAVVFAAAVAAAAYVRGER